MSNHPSKFLTVRAQSAQGRGKSNLPWILGCLGGIAIIAIVLILMGVATYYGQTSSGISIVTIKEPVESDEIYSGDNITLRALARDDDKVKQVELWVNDILVSYENTDIPGGISPFPLITTWTPSRPGVYTISARSTDSKDKQSVSQVIITVLDTIDADGDQIPDQVDRCPEQAGTEAGQGCMDRDYDGIPDDVDACPDEAGIPEDGCPSPSENDRDGDGFLDDIDACPDEAGSPTANGCIDSDGDSFADSADECPTEPGLAGACPAADDSIIDEDGDGIPDSEDACPSTAGSASNGGCPDMGGFLPPPPTPGDDDAPPEEGGIFDNLYSDPVEKAVVPVEIQANNLYIRNDFEIVTCYLDINDVIETPVRQYEFESNGTQFWDIAAQMDGENSIRAFADDANPLDISLECLGHTGDVVETLVDTVISHPAPEWDGRIFQYRTDSNELSVTYHICTPNCEESSLATPYFQAITMGPRGEGPYIARWEWDGNEDEIDGFAIAQVGPYDTTRLGIIYDPSARSLDIADIEPACGESIELVIYAFRFNEDTPASTSRVSNSQVWTSREACRHTAMVTFQFLDVHNPPGDEDGLHKVGPLEGYFYTSNGSDTVAIGFNGIWRSPNGYYHDGMKLSGGIYRIQDLFDWINREIRSCIGNGCHSHYYYAPDNDFLIIPFDQREDLVIGAHMTDDDTGNNDDDTFFNNQATVVFETYEPGYPTWVTIEDEFADIRAIVQIMPEE
jgi:hypothetical protein